MMGKRRGVKVILVILVAGILLCCGGLGVTAVINQAMPTASVSPEQLSEAEKARLAEYFHLHRSLGNAVWPGWGDGEQPVVLYNEAMVFLVGYPEPPAGWFTVPDGELVGNAWQPMSDDDFWGEPYYAQPLPASGETPQAFTVKVGEQWAASLTTKEWMQIALPQEMREQLPPVIQQIFPYFLVSDLFIGSSDKFISLIAHEAFHAFQGEMVPDQLAAAETAVRQSNNYPWHDDAHRADWDVELDLLTQAVEAEDVAETAVLAQQFLAQRAERRQAAGLSAEMIAYENQREWLEGLAKYVEMEIWRQASQAPDYQPVEMMAVDDDFEQYQTFDKRWNQEVDQIKRSANSEDTRFYYTGMAQAVILDRLFPDWKEQAFTEDVFLETLLQEAIQK
ncbi:MAG: hypothetical protein IAF02_22585 [Anaerolineae bacterium]|nr:hypothetical protein [Anaerolineae bacterium]